MDWLTKDEAEKIAEDLNVEVKDVLHMENRLSSNDSSFDGPADHDDESDVMAPSQYLEDKRFSPEDIVEADDFEQHNKQLLFQHSKILMREVGHHQQRFLSDEKVTLHDLADEYGISAERVRQIENGALKS